MARGSTWIFPSEPVPVLSAITGADFINFNDKWSQIINLQSGPDGAVYLIDWYDKNECHHNDVNGHDRSNGRIFKVSYGEPKFAKVDLQKIADQDLIQLAIDRNDWSGRHARRILQERTQKDSTLGTKIAGRIPPEPPGYDPDKKLRWLWTSHVSGGSFHPTYALLRAERIRARMGCSTTL
jgi:hypothetical protein